MNEIINRDYRKKDNLKWFNDNYFIAVYDCEDNYITSFENIESFGTAFNITINKIIKRIKNNLGLEQNNLKLKLFIYKKDKIEENVRRR